MAVGLFSPVRADEIQIEGVTITSADVSQLLAALHTAMRPNDSTIPVVVSIKSPSEMPIYDQQTHYAGLQDAAGARTMHIWVRSDLKGADAPSALLAVFALALTDGGYGGPDFKKLYDVYAAKDAQLPANAADPFLYRHKFAAALSNMIQSGESKVGNPSPSPTQKPDSNPHDVA